MKTFLYLRTDLGTRNLKSGGSVTHTLGVLDGFAKHGSKVYCASSAMHSILAQKNIHFTPLFMPRLLAFLGFKINCLLSNIVFLYAALRCIKNVQIDYIYQRYSMLTIVGLMIARIKKRPLILEFNGSEAWVDEHWSPQKKLNAQWLVMRFENWNIMYADYIVVVSHVLKDQLVARGVDARKILVNPNGVDTYLFHGERYKEQRNALRNLYGMHDRFVFGFIGSFSYWHGIEIISAMLPSIQEQVPDAHFFLIGSGPLFDWIQSEIRRLKCEDIVTLVGNIPYARASEYLSACDAFLCPSQPNKDGTPFFGSPTKLFEYMSMGKPIIASDVDQLRDIVDTTFGYLVHPHDVQGFVHAACALIKKHKAEQSKMGSCARDRAIARFSWQKHVDQIQDFIA